MNPPPVYSGMTISDQLARHARSVPGAVALRMDGVDRTYGELDVRVNRLAHALGARGAGPGERVVVMTYNGLEMAEVFFACARLGAICVPVNFRLHADEVAYQLADSGAVVAVVESGLAATFARAWKDVPTVRHCLVTGADSVPVAGMERYDDALRAAPETDPGVAVDLHAPAFVMYTSGTTGRPKGAVLTHYNLAVQTMSRFAHIGVPSDCRVWLISTPLFHIGGLAALLSSVMVGGRTVIARSGRFDPAGTVELLERERIGYCFLVPAQWQAVCDVPGIADRDLSALRLISWGAAPATKALLHLMIETFPGARLLSVFGQTESSAVSTVLLGEDALRKIGSVGTPLVNVEVRIVDEQMNDVPRGEIGEIVYRGPTIMTGYWNKPAETAAAFAGGWFHSGDLVRQDEDGYIYVVDRLKDMIISGGENIYSAEVEEAIAAHPGVAEVAVVGVPDERWGETPLAIVVPTSTAGSLTAEEVGEWCRGRLAAYKVPRRVAVVAELPRNASGKVRKHELRQAYGPAASATPTNARPAGESASGS
ncbi:fatty-acyl-CoA synthase/long-chain acyl-CoA synthetase [Nonomuraea solani]|uniref:Fatty-acyl-CoA synthase/long-chain acyl-CoA synthetase n=1 Tax=Nonomuraea solani TaxID=1144553 RepID=A0A1H6EVP7_9ACTN|nr:long-chain-fatty-acid--CoA ligase [Nonomuraea solani]SEH00995.1 fatty-acyl-CoA synthase/long-chain acyl-CoA synthetase [Nonomuraea solani]